MTQRTGYFDDFGMDTITLAGELSAKLAAMREAGFSQVMLKANDIVGHPGGVAAGVQSFRDAWQAAQEGIELERAALDSAALAQALGFWR